MSSKSFLFSVLVSLLWSSISCAHSESRLLSGTTGQEIPLAEVVRRIHPGDIVVVGELHGNATCQNQQMQLLQALRSQGLKVSVGMEFLEYPHQTLVNRFRGGNLAEADFLQQIGWGKGFPFDFYREQIRFPDLKDGSVTRALNIPRAITSKVAKMGLESLTPEEKATLPPGLTRGNARYFERFKANIGHLPNPDAAERYFWAQSIWDETMSWQALSFFQSAPEQVLVIIVGEFHVQYGGGLPDRLKARGASGHVHTFSQVSLEGLSDQERVKELQPDPIDGPRAEYLWTLELDSHRNP